MPPLLEAKDACQFKHSTRRSRAGESSKASVAWMPHPRGHARLGGNFYNYPRGSFLLRSIGIFVPLRPTSHEDFDLGVTGKLQGKSLDRGSSTCPSVTDRRLVGQDSLLPEKLLQLRLRFEAAVFGDKLVPFQMRRARNTSSRKLFVAPSINDRQLV